MILIASIDIEGLPQLASPHSLQGVRTPNGNALLEFDREKGQEEFREKINTIFASNELVFELGVDGQIVRLAPPILRESLAAATFTTGDSHLDRMLEDARSKFLNPDTRVRRESLEELWGAFERVKTLEPGSDKPDKAEALLMKASPEENFRKVLCDEMKELTDVGNRFQIRHSETNQIPIVLNNQVDYLFHRMFALIQLLLRAHDGTVQ